MDSVKKQMLKWAIRGMVVFLGGILVSRNKISQETVDFFANDLLSHLVGIVLIVIAAVEMYFKAKKDKRVENVTIKEAVEAESTTPIEVIKTRVKAIIKSKVRKL